MDVAPSPSPGQADFAELAARIREAHSAEIQRILAAMQRGAVPHLHSQSGWPGNLVIVDRHLRARRYGRVDYHQSQHRPRWRRAAAAHRHTEANLPVGGDTMRIAAIDPGLSGGAAVLEQIGGAVMLISIIDLPILGNGAKRRLDAFTFARWLDEHAPTHAHTEALRAMPRQGVTSMFRYGRRVCGAVEGVVAARRTPLTTVGPRSGSAISAAARIVAERPPVSCSGARNIIKRKRFCSVSTPSRKGPPHE
jgi:hypothetical protein